MVAVQPPAGPRRRTVLGGVLGGGRCFVWPRPSQHRGRHSRPPCFPEKKKPRKGRPSRDWRERRNAIRLTNEHTVETLVVADANMVQYHGAEAAQRFILTVMNMVSPQAGSRPGGLWVLWAERSVRGAPFSSGKSRVGVGSAHGLVIPGQRGQRRADQCPRGRGPAR